jgi:4'-phosphopantetheinyl transferase
MLEPPTFGRGGIVASRVSVTLEGVTIWMIDLCASQEIVPHYWDVLCPEEKERANRFRFSDDRLRFALTRISLRLLLAEELSGDPRVLEFSARDYGKPYLADAPHLNFNVSHSGSLGAVGISKERAIGLDIEHIREGLDVLGLAQAFFSPSEALFLASLEADERYAAFYRIWTCKEAVLKAYGFGIGEYLRDFTVILSRDNLRIEGSLNCPLGSCQRRSKNRPLGRSKSRPAAALS